MQSSLAGERFAVVIVNYNGGEALLEAVQSVLGEGVPPTQVVVVDNGSHDDSLLGLERFTPTTLILRNQCNAGFAKAVNRGLAAATAEFYLLLNNDAKLQAGALNAFAQAFDANSKLAIAGGQLLYPDGRLQSAFAPLPTLAEEVIPLNFLKWSNPGRYLRTSDSLQTREVESVFGACLAVRASALPAFGVLDEDFFFYFEEVEWCRRARRAGYLVQYVPAAQATHVLGLTANRSRNLARIELQRSKLTYFRKCASPMSYRVLSVFFVFRSMVNALSGSIACVFTLGIPAKLRKNTLAYWSIFAWHITGRPASVGFPGKCPKG